MRQAKTPAGPGTASSAAEHSPAAAVPSLAPTGVGLAFQLATRSGGADSPAEREATAAASAVTGGSAGTGDAGGGPSDGAVSAPYGIVVEDGAPLAPGQVHRSEFIEALSRDIERVAGEELTAVGRTAADCPYLAHWLTFYREQPAARIERAIQRYARPTRTDLDGLREAVLTRVRMAVTLWIRSGGRELQVPEGISWFGTDDGLPASDEDGARVLRAARPGAESPPPASDPAAVQARLGAGQPLDSGVRSRLERGYGAPFGGVRVHTDAAAAGLAAGYQARAFTVGSDVAFAAGEYRPGTTYGDVLIAHELAHVLQQRSGLGRTATSEGALEGEADAGAIAALFGRRAQVAFSSPLALRRCGSSRSVPVADRPADIADDPNYTRPAHAGDLPEYTAPTRTPTTPSVAMRLAGTDAAARAAALEELRARPDERRSWTLVLLATGSGPTDTRGAAQALVADWLRRNRAFADYVTQEANAPVGELGDLAVAALAGAGRGGSVDLANYRQVILGRLEVARRIQGELRAKLSELAGPDSVGTLFGGGELDELTRATSTGDAAELSGVGARASRLLQRFGVVQAEIQTLDANLAGVPRDGELGRALHDKMTEILRHAGAIRSGAEDAEFQAVLDAIQRAPAVFVTVMLDSIRETLVRERTQINDLVDHAPDSRTVEAVRVRVIDPLRPELDRAISLLDTARAGIESDPAGVYAYLASVRESMVSLQERVNYAALALDAAIHAYALMDIGPGVATPSLGEGANTNPDPGLSRLSDPRDQGRMLDTWLSYSQSFETFATERDRNPDEVRRRFDALRENREASLPEFESWHIRRTAEWQVAIQTARFQADAAMLLLALTPARFAGAGARAFMIWMLGEASAGVVGRLVTWAAVAGVEGTVFHFTNQGLRTLVYGEEFWGENFGTDWALSVATVGTLSAAGRAYESVTARALRAGGSTATAVRAGSLALEFGVLQSFGVIAERIHSGQWVLPNNPRFWAMAAHNLAFMGALHVGGHAVRSLNESLGGVAFRPFVRSFNTRARALDARIAEWVGSPEPSLEGAGRILRQSRALQAERLQLARALRELTPQSFTEQDLAYVTDLVRTVDGLADRTSFDSSIALRPHESAPNVYYFEGDPARVQTEFLGRGYTLVEAAPSGRLRLREPGNGAIVELLPIGRTSHALPADLRLDATTRADLEAELIRLGDPERETRALSDEALVARHRDVQRGALRGDVYPLSATPVLDEAARVEMLQELGQSYATGDAPVPGARFGFGRPEASRLVVPLAGGGEINAVVTIRLETPAGGGSHGRASGPARVTVRRRPTGDWTVEVQIDPRLQRADAESALRHEVGEAARIIRDLGAETRLSDAELRVQIERRQGAGLMREGATTLEVTPHAIEAIQELGRLFQRYQGDPTPANEAALSRMLEQMGFQHRRFGYTERRAAVVDHLAPGVAGPLSAYIEAWYNARSGPVPLDAPGRPARYARISEYTRALAGLRGATTEAARAPFRRTLANIEALARAAYNQPRLTREALLDEGFPAADIPAVLAEAGRGNPFGQLYPELESLIPHRDSVVTNPTMGATVTIDAVGALTRGGPIEGANFATVWSRLRAAQAAGRLRSETPSVSPPGGSRTSSVRLTWVFTDNSTFNIDLPGLSAQQSAGFGINQRMHGNFETAAVSGGGTEHVTETGITVPADSMPAHLLIRLDATFQSQARTWGVGYDYGRFPVER